MANKHKRPKRSERHRSRHGPCSYCGRFHKHGKRGDSCRGHKPVATAVGQNPATRA